MWPNTDTASTRSTEPSGSGSGGASPLTNARTGGERCSSTQAMLGAWMSQPKNPAHCASAMKWRSDVPGPHPKSSTHRPSHDHPTGSRLSTVARVAWPTASRAPTGSGSPAVTTRAANAAGGNGGRVGAAVAISGRRIGVGGPSLGGDDRNFGLGETVRLGVAGAHRMEDERRLESNGPAERQYDLGEDWALVGRIHPEDLARMRAVRVRNLGDQKSVRAELLQRELQEAQEVVGVHVLEHLGQEDHAEAVVA